MRTLLSIAIFLHTALCFAQAPCEKIEYAKLKDASRGYLNEQYCRAMQSSKRAQGDAQTSCIRVAEDIMYMITKKGKDLQQAEINARLDARAYIYAIEVRHARELAGIGKGRKFRREYVGASPIEDEQAVKRYREQLESEVSKEVTPPACPAN